MDDVPWCGDRSGELLATLDDIRIRLESIELFAAARKCALFGTGLSWCGKIFPTGQVSHDLARMQALATMRRSRTAGELMQFLLEEQMSGTPRRPAKMAIKQKFLDHAWTDDRVRVLRAAHQLVAHAVTLCHPRPDYEVFFPNAPDAH